MARSYPLYLSISTNRYGAHMYGSGWKYGLNYAPPQPQGLTITDLATMVDGVLTISWANPTFGWTIGITDDSLLYELQISFRDPSFTTLTVDTLLFPAPLLRYLLSPEYTLTNEGIFYARIRSTDGYTYSDWSLPLTFAVYLFGPFSPTINTVTSPADSFWQTITGTKGAGNHVFVRNNSGVWSEAQYPDGVSGARWSFNMALSSGSNNIEAIASYTSSPYGIVSLPARATIYLIVYTPEVYNIWNCFDEFGLLLGLPRIPGEKNKNYKTRLLDVYTNPANSTYQGLLNGISRELGLRPDEISVERLGDLADPTYPNNLLNSENNALGTKLVDYADEVYDHNPIFWGNIINDESYWDGVEKSTVGYIYLPHIWDASASGIYSKWLSGGTGDNDDLWINNPIEIWNPGISGYSWYLPVHTGFFYSAYPSGIIGVL